MSPRGPPGGSQDAPRRPQGTPRNCFFLVLLLILLIFLLLPRAARMKTTSGVRPFSMQTTRRTAAGCEPDLLPTRCCSSWWVAKQSWQAAE
eukprot:3288975-Pyramimonas_sp.AAC.1